MAWISSIFSGMGNYMQQSAQSKSVKKARDRQVSLDTNLAGKNENAFSSALNNFNNYGTNYNSNVADREKLAAGNTSGPTSNASIGTSGLAGTLANTMAQNKSLATAKAKVGALNDTDLADNLGIKSADTTIGINNGLARDSENANYGFQKFQANNAKNTAGGIAGQFSSAIGKLLSTGGDNTSKTAPTWRNPDYE